MTLSIKRKNVMVNVQDKDVRHSLHTGKRGGDMGGNSDEVCFVSFWTVPGPIFMSAFRSVHGVKNSPALEVYLAGHRSSCTLATPFRVL